MRLTTTVLVAIVASGIPATAHHSISMFDISTAVWVKGSVVRVERINTHAVLVLDEKKADGKVQRWVIEGTSLQGLERRGFGPDLLKTDDVIEVCGFALKAEHTRPTSPVGDASSRFVHGHTLVMPDHHMRMFGSYGKIQNCLRPTDSRQSWLDFLNTDPGARGSWCNKQLAATPSSAFSIAFAKEISSLMANPCE